MGEDAEMDDCFRAADDVLNNAVAGIAEIINVPGLVNVDFDDVKTIMGEQGKAMMGTATASGLDRARVAAEQAVASPLLEGVDLSGARGVLVNITASSSLKMKETREVMNTIRAFAAEDATVIFGTVCDEAMGDALRVTVVATGPGRSATRKQSTPFTVIKTGTDDMPMTRRSAWCRRRRLTATVAAATTATSTRRRCGVRANRRQRAWRRWKRAARTATTSRRSCASRPTERRVSQQRWARRAYRCYWRCLLRRTVRSLEFRHAETAHAQADRPHGRHRPAQRHEGRTRAASGCRRTAASSFGVSTSSRQWSCARTPSTCTTRAWPRPSSATACAWQRSST